jgi:rsbT antagonist protein RsbS
VARVPIIRLGETLIATVQDDLRDRDSFLGRMIGDIALGSRLLGAETVIVGIQPAAAITLVELGLSFKGVHTALDTEKGMALLRRLMRANGEARGG